MYTFRIAVLTCLLVLMDTQVFAGTSGGSDKFMQFFDENGDGIVTNEEFENSAKSRFTRMDANNDGKITQDEFTSYIMDRREIKVAEKLKSMDTNKDNRISKDEYIAHYTEKAAARFGRLDKNNDGEISAEEFQYRSDKFGHRGHGERIFKKLDNNEDGVVTQQESFAAWSAWFAKIDANGDKVVTQDEVVQYRDRKREQFKNEE